MRDYLIAHIGHTGQSSEHITWWRPDSRGYTICIEKAGLYTEDEARSICSRSICIAVRSEHAALISLSTPYYRKSDGRLAKLYDGDHHRVVPNSKEAWKHLLSGRLSGCAEPMKPTPINLKKTRAIYIDDLTPATK